MFKKILKEISEINKNDGASQERMLVKAMEEFGELAEAINWKTKYKNTDKSIEEINKLINEESIDVLVCIFAILDKNNANPNDLKKILNKKCKKWYKNLLQKNKNINTFDIQNKY